MDRKNVSILRIIYAVLGLTAMTILPSYVAADENYLGELIVDPIKTDAGNVAGTVLDEVRVNGVTPLGYAYDASIGDIGHEVRVYRGIPYGAPPVGDLRWKPPQRVSPWDGIRECTKFSPMAPQPFPASFLYESVPESGMSEDCLYLNVLTPAKRTGERLPVIVWFHGGGLTIGSGNPTTFNTGFIPQHGAVLVTVQHRLGPIGYMAHPALSAESPNGVSGNYGQLDLIAALKWVQRNIAAFGGNPHNVTIIGQSGGGQKVLWLMASPLAKGLFHRAICQSGGIGGTPLATAEQSGLNLAAKLGISGSGKDALTALRAKPWRDLIVEANKPDSGYSTVFAVDGWSMIDTGPNVFATGRQNDVPLMIGYAGAEMSATKSPYTLGLIPAIKQKSDVYVYLFTHMPKNWADQGAFAWHGSDVAYEFGTQEILVKNLGVLLPATLNPDPGINYRDDWVAHFMAYTLVQFAATGDPNLNAYHRWHKNNKFFWPPYDDSDQYLDIGFPPVVGKGFSALSERQPPRQ